MSTTKPIAQQFAATSGGTKTLADANYIRDSILYMNSTQSTYGIAAAGTTQATATPLGSVLNQIDTATVNQGVNLPLSTGRHNVPFQWCVIINNTAVNISVYGSQGSADTINGTAGSTAQVVAPGICAIFNSAKGGAWFCPDIEAVANRGTVTLAGATPQTVANATLTANSLVVFTLKTVGGTVGAYPAIQTVTPGTGFTVQGTAGDTSVYNYLIIG